MANTAAIDPALTHVLIFGPGFWGRGKTEGEAKRNCPSDRMDRFIVYRCSPGTYVSRDGGLCWPNTDPQPVEVRRVGIKSK